MKGKKVRKHLRNAVICLTAFASIFTLAGCDGSLQNRTETLSDNIVNVCNEQVVDYDLNYKMEDFKLIGADINKSSFDFDVSFNGISSFTDDSIGYTSVNYTVPSTFFTDVKKNSSYTEMYNIFDRIVAELDPTSIAVSPVNDLVAVNDAFVKNEPILFEGFKNNRSLVFNLGAPEFDDATNSINFDMKSLIEVRKGKVSPGFGIGIGFNGYVGLGFGVHINKAEGTFVTTNNYKFTVDKETYEKMKNDPALVYDYCVSAINSKDHSKITAERINTVSVPYNEADLIKRLDIKDINKELSE